MEEDEFRATYREVNPQRCVFEKAVLTRRCGCHRAERFCIAEREGVRCRSAQAQAACRAFLDGLRENALFALKLTQSTDTLPHAKEIKVQNGGLIGLQRSLHPERQETEIGDITALVEEAISRYGAVGNLPYSEIMRAVVSFEGRPRRRRGR